MPRGDGTGPMGAGPMTGRAAGYCNDFSTQNPGNYRGFGRGAGRGLGRGFCRMDNGFRNFSPAVDERTFLENQTTYLENQLLVVKQRLSEMKVSE